MTEYMTAEKARKNNEEFRNAVAKFEETVREIDRAIERVSLNGLENKFSIQLFSFSQAGAPGSTRRWRQADLIKQHYRNQGFNADVHLGGVPHGAYLKLNWEVR